MTRDERAQLRNQHGLTIWLTGLSASGKSTIAVELEHQLLDSGSETLIMLDAFYPRYTQIATRVPVKRVIVTGIQDALPFPKNVLYPLKARREGTWVNVRVGGAVHDFGALLRAKTSAVRCCASRE